MKRQKQPNPEARVRLPGVAVVLFRPRLPENIGAAARAACNMGLKRLIAVQPQDLDFERMAMMATGPAVELLTRLEVYDDLAGALAPFQYVVGATARLGGVRRAFFTPREMADTLCQYRDIYGVTFFTVQDNHIDSFAKVIAELR